MEILNQEALLACIQTAKDSGCPRDQVEQFIKVGYIPLPWQFKFHAAAREADLPDGPVDIGAGGARGPGKSHVVLAQAGLDDCQRIPNLKGLFLRQTGISAQESFDDLVLKVIQGHVSYRKTGQVLRFDNGSRILLGGFQDEGDIDRYIGIEYDFIIVEELNQLTEDKYTKLRGSLRTSKSNWRPRMYTSFNPGGIGHAFVKERYVTPHRDGTETKTRFIPSNYRYNPYLNREYLDYLEGLTGDLAKAWREGEWEIFAGQFFSIWRESLHVIPPFMPNKKCVLVGGLDWGRVDNFSFHVTEVSRYDADGVHFYRSRIFMEVYGTEKNPKEWSDEIKKQLKFYDLILNDLAWIRADTQIWSKSIDAKALDIHTQFIQASEGWRLLRAANKDRIGGWENLQRWFSIAPDGKPYLQIASNCPNAIRVIPSLIYDENHKQDVDQKGENDAADSIRYLHMALKWIDGSVGRMNHPQPTTQRMKPTAQFIAGKQVSVNIDRWSTPTVAPGGRVGGVRRV